MAHYCSAIYTEDYPYIDDLQYEQSIAGGVAQLTYVKGHIQSASATRIKFSLKT